MNEIKKNYEILSTAIHEINLSKQQSVNLIDVQLVWASDLNLDTVSDLRQFGDFHRILHQENCPPLYN
jgi:hypothetical protein